jgi:GT2 family glycosyltransferase
MIAAITITYNRIELTKQTIESFYSKTDVDFHLFVDNGSEDETKEWIKYKYHIPLEKNMGIAYAFALGVEALSGKYDYILKLDNDVETVTEGIIGKMVKFLEKHPDHVISPVDLLLDPNFKPRTLRKSFLEGYNVEYTTHTGGAFQLGRREAVEKLCKEFRHLKLGDLNIGMFYRNHGYHTAYLQELEMRHIGLNQSTPGKNYIM